MQNEGFIDELPEIKKKERGMVFELRNLAEQYYDVQQKRVQAYNRVVCWVRENIGMDGILREAVKEAAIKKGREFDLQKVSELINLEQSYEENVERIEKELGVILPPLKQKYAWYADKLIEGKVALTDIENMVWCCGELIKLESELESKIKELVGEFQIYTDYLSKIRGVGPVLAGGLIGWIAPIERFDYPSRLRAYAGLTAQHYRLRCEEGHRIIATNTREICPVRKKKGTCGAKIVEVQLVNSPPKKTMGYYTMVCFKLKTLAWKIARRFEYQTPRRSYYRYLYDKIKAYYANREDAKNLSKGHIRGRALLWTASMFFNHLWETWRRLEGLPIREPYPIEKLGHTPKLIAMTDDKSPLVPRFRYV